MIGFSVPASDILSASATASTTGLVTVPGGRYLSADIQLSATSTVAGTSAPRVNYVVPGGTTGAGPANGSVLARVVAAGLVGSATSTSDTTEILVYGGDNGCTIDFTAGTVGSSSVVINGIFF